MNEKTIVIENTSIHYLETDKQTGRDILLLHGMKFNSGTWMETGTLELLEKEGFHAIAVDLPGFGKSENLDMGKKETLEIIIERLGLSEPIIVAPSMSGGYSLSVLAEGKIKLGAYVAVAPTNIPDYREALRGNSLSTLAIWGSNDQVVSPENADILCSAMTNAKKVIIENGGHPTYLIETTVFHQHVMAFLKSL